MERIAYKDLPEGLMQTMYNVQAYVDRSGLEYKLLKLIRFRVSQINSCAFCLDMHYKEAIHAGEDPIRLVSLSAWRETPYYTPREAAALAFAETLTKLPADVNSDTIHDELKKHFTQHEIAHLTLAIVQINSWNRITRSFNPEPGKYQVPIRKMAGQAN